jgi:hypothetical protein
VLEERLEGQARRLQPVVLEVVLLGFDAVLDRTLRHRHVHLVEQRLQYAVTRLADLGDPGYSLQPFAQPPP